MYLPKTEVHGVFKPRLVVLDYDETTVDNTFDFYEAYCAALKLHGARCLEYSKFLALFSENKLHSEVPSRVDQESFWKTFRRLYQSRYSWLRAGLSEFLVYAKSLDTKIVIVSGRETPSQNIWLDLRKHGISEFIDDVYTLWDSALMGGEEGFLFDKSFLVSYVKTKYGVHDNFVCIGDFPTDYYSCVKAGGTFIGLTPIPERAEHLKKAGAKLVASNFKEVLVILSDIGFFD